MQWGTGRSSLLLPRPFLSEAFECDWRARAKSSAPKVLQLYAALKTTFGDWMTLTVAGYKNTKYLVPHALMQCQPTFP